MKVADLDHLTMCSVCREEFMTTGKSVLQPVAGSETKHSAQGFVRNINPQASRTLRRDPIILI